VADAGIRFVPITAGADENLKRASQWFSTTRKVIGPKKIELLGGINPIPFLFAELEVKAKIDPTYSSMCHIFVVA
jgi:hypothetical protein